jgi:hypothetical protein
VVAQGYALLVSRGDNVEILFGREPASEPLGQDQGFISYVIREVSFFLDELFDDHNQMAGLGKTVQKN